LKDHQREEKHHLVILKSKRREEVQTTIIPAHFYASGQGVAVVEFENPEQIANRMAAGTPITVYKKISPLVPATYWGAAVEEHGK